MPQHGLLTGQTQQQYYDSGNYGGYRFISLSEVIDNFAATYTGEGKLLEKTNLPDISFHAHRALAELSFDTFKSCKSKEIVVPNSLTMILPHDYVNYTKISWVDSSGIKHRLYPTTCNTSNPKHFYQNEDGDHSINPVGTLAIGSNIVVLDDDYSGILVHGMRVVSPNLPLASYIHNITTTSGITSITLKNKDGTTNKNAILTTNEQLEITRFFYLGHGLRLFGQSLIETTVTAASAIGDTALNVTSVSGIEIGMHINSSGFVNDNSVDGGTGSIKVVGIGTSTVELSHPSSFAVANGAVVGFVSNNTDSTTWSNYKSGTPSENQDDYQDDTYWPMGGERYGLDPQHAQANGSFYIDCQRGKIHFSSNISGKTVILDYISDSLGTDAEMQVHKFAEEAIYKWIAYGCLSAIANVPQHVLARFKKEKFAETRKAKIRLSNIKLDEIAQILRGKSKHIKH